jgi:5-methyltetrahydrofolate--homocysteine methyltransferase
MSGQDPQPAYGYWPCAADGNDVILYDPDGGRELTRFSFPRQNKESGLCIPDAAEQDRARRRSGADHKAVAGVAVPCSACRS